MKIRVWCAGFLVATSLLAGCGGGDDDNKNNTNDTPTVAQQVCKDFCTNANCPATYCTSPARKACEAYCDAEDHCDAAAQAKDCYDYQCNHQLLPTDTAACQAAAKTYYDCLKGLAASCGKGCDAEGTALGNACT